MNPVHFLNGLSQGPCAVQRVHVELVLDDHHLSGFLLLPLEDADRAVVGQPARQANLPLVIPGNPGGARQGSGFLRVFLGPLVGRLAARDQVPQHLAERFDVGGLIFVTFVVRAGFRSHCG